MPKTKAKAKAKAKVQKSARRKVAATRATSRSQAMKASRTKRRNAQAICEHIPPYPNSVVAAYEVEPADTQSQRFNYNVVEPNLGFLQDKYLTAQALLTDASEALQQAAEFHKQRQEECQKAYNELKKACATALDA